ncbi:hypothetical protein HDV00_009314 [Rhizophlyctis rosea]|nr:hypothetical protein HDV00_009314 [Rhizophlyctis rosea]
MSTLDFADFFGDVSSEASPALTVATSPAYSVVSDFGIDSVLFDEAADRASHSSQLFDSLFPSVTVPAAKTGYQSEQQMFADLFVDIKPDVAPFVADNPVPFNYVYSPNHSPISSPVPNTPPVAYHPQPSPVLTSDPSPSPPHAGQTLANAQEQVRMAFPQLMPAVERVRAALIEAISNPPQATPVPLMVAPRPPGADMSPVSAPLFFPAPVTSPAIPTSTLLPAVASINGLNPQAIASIQARQNNNPPLVKSSIQVPLPPYSVGRKRKDPPMDAATILAEMEMKRQKNTEAARRSRARKMERLDTLEVQCKELIKERDDWKKKVEQMEREREEREAQFAEEIRKLKGALGM